MIKLIKNIIYYKRNGLTLREAYKLAKLTID